MEPHSNIEELSIEKFETILHLFAIAFRAKRHTEIPNEEAEQLVADLSEVLELSPNNVRNIINFMVENFHGDEKAKHLWDSSNSVGEEARAPIEDRLAQHLHQKFIGLSLAAAARANLSSSAPSDNSMSTSNRVIEKKRLNLNFSQFMRNKFLDESMSYSKISEALKRVSVITFPNILTELEIKNSKKNRDALRNRIKKMKKIGIVDNPVENHIDSGSPFLQKGIVLFNDDTFPSPKTEQTNVESGRCSQKLKKKNLSKEEKYELRVKRKSDMLIWRENRRKILEEKKRLRKPSFKTGLLTPENPPYLHNAPEGFPRTAPPRVYNNLKKNPIGQGSCCSDFRKVKIKRRQSQG